MSPFRHYYDSSENRAFVTRPDFLKGSSVREINIWRSESEHTSDDIVRIYTPTRFVPHGLQTDTLLKRPRFFPLVSSSAILSVTALRLLAQPAFSLTLNDEIVHRIGQIPEVEKIYLIEENGIKKIFTIINNNDLNAKRSIYEQEGNIIDNYTDECIEFNVIWREDRELDSIKYFPENPIYEML